MLYFATVPDVWDQPVERWADWCYDRTASPDKPNFELFEHGLVDLGDTPSSEGSVADHQLALGTLTELHERYSEWTLQYTAAQLSQGIYALFSYPCDFSSFIADEDMPCEPRSRVMRSLVVPYRVYVKGWSLQEAMPDGWHMLWDLVLDGVYPVSDLAPVALECLQDILALDDLRCQAAALHGLNHLDHPDRPAVVQRWMDAHRNEDWNWDWVEACRDGTAL